MIFWVARLSDGVFVRTVGFERTHNAGTEVVIECDPSNQPDPKKHVWDGADGFRLATQPEIDAYAEDRREALATFIANEPLAAAIVSAMHEELVKAHAGTTLRTLEELANRVFTLVEQKLEEQGG